MERARPGQQSAAQDTAEDRKPELTALIPAFHGNTPGKISHP